MLTLAFAACSGDAATGSLPLPLDSDDARRAVEALSAEFVLLENELGPAKVVQVRRVQGADDRLLVVHELEKPVPSQEFGALVCGENDGWVRGTYGIVDYAIGKQAFLGLLSSPWAGCGETVVAADASAASLIDGVTPQEAESAVREMLQNLYATDFLAQHPFTVEEVSRAYKDEPEPLRVRVRFEVPFPPEDFLGESCDVGHLSDDFSVTGAYYHTSAEASGHDAPPVSGAYGLTPVTSDGLDCV